MPYAEETSVPVERSRAEIEHLLRKYGADQFASGWSGDRAMIQFRAEGRTVRFVLPLPDPQDKQFTQHLGIRISRVRRRRRAGPTNKRCGAGGAAWRSRSKRSSNVWGSRSRARKKSSCRTS
jgi:hypothetical protein